MRIILCVFISLWCMSLFGQEGERCLNTIQNNNDRLGKDSEFKSRFEEWQKKIAPIVRERREQKNPGCTSGPIIIPVAVHFDNGIVQPSEEACVITIVQEQIDELNLEMLGLDSDAGLINNFTSCFGSGILGDACMEFCIANQNHPTGYGLNNGDLAITFGDVNFNVTGNNYTPVNSDWAGYVNIYVDDLGNNLLGVSNGIPGNFNGDGVLINNCVFGTGNVICSGVQTTGTSGCFATYDEGETLAHEIGHYFGLFHIWGDNGGCGGSQDGIPDTPNMSTNYSGYSGCGNHNTCSDLPQTCNSEDMYMNFMSYASDGCMYMFTSDQSDVMYATAVSEGYTTTSSKCSGNAPTADFSPQGNISLCLNECINFMDLSTNNPDTWAWTFNVTSGNLTIDISSSILQNPIVCHTGGTSGTITTQLTASNANGSDMITYTQQVTTFINTYYADTDGDGYGDANTTMTGCTPPSGFVTDNTDCDDTDPNVNPGVPEVCDGIDNNCDGNIDEDATTPFFADVDGDTFGDANSFITACTAPAGYVSNSSDCDDGDATIYPGATELCDGQINDCNTTSLPMDESDFDNDGYVACTIDAGGWDGNSSVIGGSDCDDTDANSFPGNTELCDGVDNNCDGNIDEGLGQMYYADTDGDGFGDTNNSVSACSAPSGYVANDTDCDDMDANNYPGNTEVCDGVDNNCDGMIDEGLAQTYYVDSDGDGYGDSNSSISACTAPSGYVANDTDCDDMDANNYPGNTEVCDGSDNNCDGVIDEGCGPAPNCDGDYLVINTINQNTYRAEINILSNAVINNGQTILYTAGTDIDLVYPFEVVIGTEFEARIEPCTPVPMQQGGNIESRTQREISNLLSEHFTDSDLISVIIENQNGDFIWTVNDLQNLNAQILINQMDKEGSGLYTLNLFTRKKTILQKIVFMK